MAEHTPTPSHTPHMMSKGQQGREREREREEILVGAVHSVADPIMVMIPW
jgi:hypothetical protein